HALNRPASCAAYAARQKPRPPPTHSQRSGLQNRRSPFGRSLLIRPPIRMRGSGAPRGEGSRNRRSPFGASPFGKTRFGRSLLIRPPIRMRGSGEGSRNRRSPFGGNPIPPPGESLPSLGGPPGGS